MPVRTYMVIDPRHDHGFRVPRPDLSVRYGTPNACNDCHRDRSPAWAAAAVEKWHGPQRKGLQAWTPAFHAARAGAVESKNLLFAVAEDRGQPAIGRATAYAELSAYVSPSLLPELRKGLHDDSELVRIGALRGLASLPVEQRWAYAGHLLSDPVHSVRIEAVSFLLGVAPETLAPEQRAALDRAVEEYIAVQRLNADRPEAHLNLGLLHAHRRAADQAEREYRAALKIDPGFVQAYVNLADLYRDQGRDGDGEKVLRDGLQTQPGAAALHHALGLLQVRRKQPGAALASLARAAKADPANPRYAYVQGIALHSANRRSEALSVLDANHRRHSADRDTLMALVSMHREAGAAETALAYARKLQVLLPAEPDVQQLVRQLETGE
jgi:Tfp pilus assembly protein PilF